MLQEMCLSGVAELKCNAGVYRTVETFPVKSEVSLGRSKKSIYLPGVAEL